jgi:hypothetical protein
MVTYTIVQYHYDTSWKAAENVYSRFFCLLNRYLLVPAIRIAGASSLYVT